MQIFITYNYVVLHMTVTGDTSLVYVDKVYTCTSYVYVIIEGQLYYMHYFY